MIPAMFCLQSNKFANTQIPYTRNYAKSNFNV